MKPDRPRGEERALHTHRSEQLLIEHLEELPGDRLLCTTLGRAQFAAVAALRAPSRRVTCQFLDLYRAQESRALHGDLGGRLDIACTADFPEGEFDAAALPGTATGEAELVRERMQEAYLRLIEGGRLAVSTDNPRDSFFHEEMQKLFPKVTRLPEGRGVVYIGTKQGQLKKVRDFSTRFPYRDRGTLLSVFTRPGVFSHRRIDPGSRALLEAVEVQAGMRVLDLGCGAGPIAAALAARAEGGDDRSRRCQPAGDRVYRADCGAERDHHHPHASERRSPVRRAERCRSGGGQSALFLTLQNCGTVSRQRRHRSASRRPGVVCDQATGLVHRGHAGAVRERDHCARQKLRRRLRHQAAVAWRKR